MGLLALRRDIRDLDRLGEIITILASQGFHDLVEKAKLGHHAKLNGKPRSVTTTPALVRETLERLGPTFVKLGQVLSLRPDLIPPAYCDEFKKLQDGVAPISFPVVKGIVESELRRPLTKVFKSFSKEPLASASIAQVHRATLLDGQQVAVKVQRPGIRDVMARDIDIMAYVAVRIDRHVAAIRAVDIVEEFKAYTERELDLRFEMRNIKRFRDFFADDEEVRIAAIHEELCSQNLLVMEFMRGTPVSDRAALIAEGFDLKGLASIGMRTLLRQVFEFGIFHADPHPGNLLAVRVGKRQCLALLDFGIVGFMDERLQECVLDLVEALIRRDVRTVARTLVRMGASDARIDRKGLEQSLMAMVMDWSGTTLREQRMSTLISRVISVAIEKRVRIPADVVLAAKAFVTIEGTGSWLDPDFNISEQAAPVLSRLRAKRFGPKRLSQEIMGDVRELRNVTRELPYAAETLIETIENGRLGLALDKAEFRRLERDYDAQMSRRILATVAAAFFVGSALIAALAPQLLFLSLPLYQLGFVLFIVTLLMLGYVTVKTHKYLEEEL